jgi:hypothetical protein
VQNALDVAALRIYECGHHVLRGDIITNAHNKWQHHSALSLIAPMPSQNHCAFGSAI